MSFGMLTVWVQFLRNFLCVVKAIFPNSAAIHYRLSSKTTIVEYLIATFQFYAVVVNCLKGIKSIYEGLNMCYKTKILNKYYGNYTLLKPKMYLVAIQHRIDNEFNISYVLIFNGILQIIIGFGFIFLTCNSLHINGPTHPKPVYDALIAQELCLSYFLYLLLQSCFKSITVYNEHKFVLSMLDKIKSKLNEQDLMLMVYDHYANGVHEFFKSSQK